MRGPRSASIVVRRRTLPPIEQLRAELAEHGVTDAPAEAPDPESLQALLDMALFCAEVKKRVSFPGFHWSDPGFVASDARVTLRFAYTELAADLLTTLEANLPRLRDGRTLLAIDAHRRKIPEFEIQHALFGQVTLFQWPHKPSEPADPRIHDAREAGWTPTLKEHNLLPGRGIVVLDEHQGILLRDERMRAIPGILLLAETGQTRLWWNPFAERADPDLQHWMAWGAGTSPASAWREQLYVEDARDE